MSVESGRAPSYHEEFFSDDERREITLVGRAVNEMRFLEGILSNPKYNPGLSSISFGYEMKVRTSFWELVVSLQFPDDEEEIMSILYGCYEELAEVDCAHKSSRLTEEEFQLLDIDLNHSH